MKKRKSIFWTTTLIVLPLVLLANLAVLFAAHHNMYEVTYNNYIGDIQNAAAVADELIGNLDLNDAETEDFCNRELTKLCSLLDTTYIYALDADKEQKTVKYLTVGTGENAPEDLASERHMGYVVHNELNKGILAALDGDSGNAVEHINKDSYESLIFYMKRTSDKNELIAAEVSVADIMSELNRNFNFVALIIILFTVAVVMIFAVIIRGLVSRPAQAVSKKMTSFVSERKSGFEPLKIKGSREFADMAESFNSMAKEIDLYLGELNEMNRQKAELSIARDIQMGLLEPTEFDSAAACIRAFMLPAKLVGGDLYDYQVLHDGKICVIIGDVSGKGISVALFMSRAITLLHQYAESGMSPGKILYEYNNHLAARNPNMLFITTFVGIYDPKTETLYYANSGHNFPYIVSDKLTVLDGEQGMAAGIFENQSYTEHSVKMKPGDLLFLYTDGVTESKNVDGCLYGEKALESVLGGLIGSVDKDAVSEVLRSVEEFAKGTEQADDVTMLTLRIPGTRRKELSVEAKTENLKDVFEAISQLHLSEEMKSQLTLMAEEMFVNICYYAYPDSEGTADITIEYNSEKAVMTFADSGKPFDPTNDVLQIEEYDIGNTVGGLGRFLTFSIADGYSYERKDGKNFLTITKLAT